MVRTDLGHCFLPSSGLVNALCNEVGREGVFELLAVLKGIVGLSVRHAATLKPAVEHLGDPLQLALPTARWDGQAINAASTRTLQQQPIHHLTKTWPKKGG